MKLKDKMVLKAEKGSGGYIVIGSGIAGLFTAILLADKGPVTVFSKQDLIAGNTWFAQGGIAAAFAPEDSPSLHFDDTWEAGACFGNREAIRLLVEEAPARINDLLMLGVKFDRANGAVALGREGAHSQNRILHIGGDATGKELIEVLLAVAREKGVSFVEDAFVDDLLVVDGCCRGIIYLRHNKLRLLGARAVILATGGCGQFFEYTTNAPAITGDGLSLAYRAGAVIRDLEFFQFHPTVFLPPQGQPFLISEAVRGEGAYLVNSKGQRFMDKYHERAELGPRDIVSRSIVDESQISGEPVYLDLRHLGAKFIPERFPTIYQRCFEWGIDITNQLIPVTPAAHYLIGGVKVDLDGQTAVKNLYAVGEIASTGVHGANRLASNSLLEGLVFGYRAASSIVEIKDFNYNEDNADMVDINLNPADHAAESECLKLRAKLQYLMWKHVGLVRDEENLLFVKEQLTQWLPMIDYNYSSVGSNENRNILLGACMMCEAALARRESRGCHYRSDYPLSDSALASQRVVFFRPDNYTGSLDFYPQAVVETENIND